MGGYSKSEAGYWKLEADYWTARAAAWLLVTNNQHIKLT